MINIIDNSDNIVPFRHVLEGNVFRYQGSHYIKVYNPDGDNNAVMLETGTLQYFNVHDSVIEIDLEIHVKEVEK